MEDNNDRFINDDLTQIAYLKGTINNLHKQINKIENRIKELEEKNNKKTYLIGKAGKSKINPIDDNITYLPIIKD